jgi:type VI secretion system secreted protein Hcp
VLAWSWGMSQSGTTHLGTGGGAGKVSVQDLSVTHYVDKASADLVKACTRGDHIAKATLVVRKAGGDAKALEYIKIEMENVIVTSVSAGGSGGEDRLTENVTLNFQKYKYQYKQQTEKGAEGATPEFSWDIAANKE